MTSYLSIEKSLQSHEKKHAREAGHDYFTKYTLLKNRLTSTEYTQAMQGFQGGNDHGPQHIFRVLDYLDRLVGNSPRGKVLSDYELFIAMMSVLYHDVGILLGRSNHSDKSAFLLSLERNDYVIDPIDKKYMAVAVRDHSSSKDIEQDCASIPEDLTVRGQTLRIRRVAALVRLADELDEDARRSPADLEEKMRVPAGPRPDWAKSGVLELPSTSRFFWSFNRRVEGVSVRPKHIGIAIQFQPEDPHSSVTLPTGETKNFVRTSIEKVLKINQERKRCCAFLPSVAQYPHLELTLLPLPGDKAWITPWVHQLGDHTTFDELWPILPRSLRGEEDGPFNGGSKQPASPPAVELSASKSVPFGSENVSGHGPNDTLDRAPRVIHPLPRIADFQSREVQLRDVRTAIQSNYQRVICFRGIGGCGKSVLMGQLISEITSARLPCRPSGVFVWSFYRDVSPTEFFRALHHYVAGEHAKESTGMGLYYLLSELLACERRLFIVLDGIERIQSDGLGVGPLGRIEDQSLRLFLTRCVDGLGGVTILITTRFPLSDFSGQTDRVLDVDLDQLPLDVCIQLLSSGGVLGSASKLADIVGKMGQHALTLSLMATVVREFHGGDPDQIVGSVGLARMDQSEKLSKVLIQYERCLGSVGGSIMRKMSAFARGVSQASFLDIYVRKTRFTNEAIGDLAKIGVSNVKLELKRLLDLRLLELENSGSQAGHISCHPAVKDYFYQRMLGGRRGTSGDLHEEVRLFLKRRPFGERLTSADIPMFEDLVYHTVQARKPDEAFQVCFGRINVFAEIGGNLGDYSAVKRIAEKFLDPRTRKAPLRYAGYQQAMIFNTLGLSCMRMGELQEASDYLRQAVRVASDDLTSKGIYTCNLAALHLLRGLVSDAVLLLGEVECDEPVVELFALSLIVHVHLLRGNRDKARDTLERAGQLSCSDLHIALIASEARIFYLLDAGRTNEAEQWASTAIDMYCKARPAEDLARAKYVLASVLLDRMELEAFDELLGDAIEYALNSGWHELLVRCRLLQLKREIAVRASLREVEGAFESCRSGCVRFGFALLELELLVVFAEYMAANGVRAKANERFRDAENLLGRLAIETPRYRARIERGRS